MPTSFLKLCSPLHRFIFTCRVKAQALILIVLCIYAEIIILLFCSYGYSKERFVWSLISAVGIFCLGSGATIVHGFQNLWTSQVLVQVNFYS